MKLRINNKVLDVCALFFFTALMLPFHYQGQNYTALNFEGQPLGRPTENVMSFHNLLANKSLSAPCQEFGVDPKHDFIVRNEECYLVNEPFFMFYHLPATIYGLLGGGLNTFYSLLVVSNAGISAACIYVFYLVLQRLGLKKKTCLLGGALFGFATGLIIYSRLIFVHTVNILLFLLLINEYLKKKKNEKKILLLSSLMVLNRLVSFFIVLPFLYNAFKDAKSKKEFFRNLLLIFLITNSPRLLWNHVLTGNPLLDPHFVNMESTSTLFSVIPKWVRAPVFDAHNYQSENETIMPHALYSFADQSKNGLFLRYHGMFYALFSSDGIVFNSPFIIFALLGMVRWRKNKHLKLFAAIILLNLLLYSLDYKGGFGPRYARFYFPTLVVLMLLSMKGYESSGMKSKIFFSLLIIFSITNNVSLAVRTDWFYENAMSRVSNDLILFPYYPVQETLATHALSFQGPEKLLWITSQSCPPSQVFEGFILRVCDCQTPSRITNNVTIPENATSMRVTYCSGSAGGDGLYLNVGQGDGEQRLIIPSGKCGSKTIEVRGGVKPVTLRPEVKGACEDETILVKSIRFE